MERHVDVRLNKEGMDHTCGRWNLVLIKRNIKPARKYIFLSCPDTGSLCAAVGIYLDPDVSKNTPQHSCCMLEISV